MASWSVSPDIWTVLAVFVQAGTGEAEPETTGMRDRDDGGVDWGGSLEWLAVIL